ncbi:MAG: hypothetical protein HY288_03415 [Planctomycetia bacterium]|nr:hypothetical protein [Planctomycetia bacterium]
MRGLLFTPTANQVAPNQTVTTSFTLLVSDGFAATSDSSTTVVAIAITSAEESILVIGISAASGTPHLGPPTSVGAAGGNTVSNGPGSNVSVAIPTPDGPAFVMVLDQATNIGGGGSVYQRSASGSGPDGDIDGEKLSLRTDRTEAEGSDNSSIDRDQKMNGSIVAPDRQRAAAPDDSVGPQTPPFQVDLVSALDPATLVSETLAEARVPAFQAEYLSHELDALARILDSDSATPSGGAEAVRTFGCTVSIGYVIWSLRARQLFGVFLAGAPLWTQLDPLILLRARKRKHEPKSDEENETLQSLAKSLPAKGTT